jgi:glycosyltransferase involved in cell wall biosynthesis
VAIYHAVKDWLVKERSVPDEKVTVIHYGIEPERFSQPTNASRKACALPRGDIVGSIGRLEPRKGHDSLIKAMATVCKELPHASLLIAGHDPWSYGPTLQGLISQLGLNGRVRLVGFHDDVASFLANLNVFAFASRSEGFGQVLIEAMAAGKPVLASKIPPLTEIVNDGETGLLVDPDDPEAFADAIVWLLSHREQARQMGKHGQQRVFRYFSAQRMTDETLSLYNTLLRS